MKTEQFIFSKKIIISILVMILILTSTNIIMASAENIVNPTDNQCIELRAVSVNDVENQNKQVIMELWGNNIEFKRI